MVKASNRLRNMADEAMAGMGLIYGPIKPETNIIGNSAVMMVKVAMIVGLPTSATA